jgi:hypothetical protein
VLDIFVRALPHVYRDVPAEPGQSIQLSITGGAGGQWTLHRQEGGWELFTGHADGSAARIHMDQETAWKLFSKGISPEAARARVTLEGDPTLGRPILGALAVMA